MNNKLYLHKLRCLLLGSEVHSGNGIGLSLSTAGGSEARAMKYENLTEERLSGATRR